MTTRINLQRRFEVRLTLGGDVPAEGSSREGLLERTGFASLDSMLGRLAERYGPIKIIQEKRNKIRLCFTHLILGELRTVLDRLRANEHVRGAYKLPDYY